VVVSTAVKYNPAIFNNRSYHGLVEDFQAFTGYLSTNFPEQTHAPASFGSDITDVIRPGKVGVKGKP
jgi:hypothetical protein